MQKCPICLESLTSGSTNHTATTSCGHLFHVYCIQNWFARGMSTCPKCLRNISKDKLIRIYLEPSESDVQIPQETDENSRWSKIANSVAYFSEANSVSLISNPESTQRNPRTSNPETTQNHLERANTEKRADSELANPETTRPNPSRGDPTTTPVQYISTNTFANADEMVVNSVAYSVSQNSPSARSTRSTRHARSTRSEEQDEWERIGVFCCCGTFFIMFIMVPVLLVSQNSGKEQVSFKNQSS